MYLYVDINHFDVSLISLSLGMKELDGGESSSFSKFWSRLFFSKPLLIVCIEKELGWACCVWTE